MEYVADMNMGISFSNYDLTESQKEIVKKYVEYHFISKDEFDKSSKLNQAYLSYSNEISQLIAKSEVYDGVGKPKMWEPYWHGWDTITGAKGDM